MTVREMQMEIAKLQVACDSLDVGKMGEVHLIEAKVHLQAAHVFLGAATMEIKDDDPTITQ